MSSSDTLVVRRWDGKAKVATIWTSGANDPDLHLPGANCRVYTSDELRAQDEPSFKVPFEKLVVHKCQPLIRKLTIERSAQPSSDCVAPQAGDGQILKALKASKSTCFLVLPPPKSYNADETRQYNLTTRNFFAWIAGAPVVGLDPASALLALKVRMDSWRAPSCDNVATVHQYAQDQSYGDSGSIQRFMTNHLQGVPSIPTDYRLVSSTDAVKGLKKNISRATKFRQSIRRHTTPTPKSHRQGLDQADTLLSRRETALVSSSSQADGSHHLVFVSGALSAHPAKLTLSHLPQVNTSRLTLNFDTIAEVDDTEDPPASIKNHGTMPSPVADTQSDGVPNLPELDGNGFNEQSSWVHNLSKEIPHANDAPTSSSPLVTEPPRSYGNPPHRNLMSSSRKRASSLTRPPSPIEEETITPTEKPAVSSQQSIKDDAPNNSSPVERVNLGSTPSSAMSVTTIDGPDSCRHKHNSNSSANSTQSERVRRAVCMTCKRSKMPSLGGLRRDLDNPKTDTTNLSLTPKSSESAVSLVSQRQAPLNRALSGKGKQRQNDDEETVVITRFPSLHNVKIRAALTSVPDLPPRSAARLFTDSNEDASSRKVLKNRLITSAPEFPARPTSKRSMKSTPLSEQRYTPSIRSVASAECETPRATTPTDFVELPASTTRAEEIGDVTQSRPVSRADTSLQNVSSRELINAMIVKANGIKVSLALNPDEHSSTIPAGLNYVDQQYERTMDDDGHELLLEQLLDGIKVIEMKNQTSKRRTRPTKQVERSDSRLSTTPSHAASTKGSIMSAAAAAKRVTWPGSLKRWQTNNSMATTKYNPEGISKSPGSTRDGNRDGVLEVRVLTLNQNGEFSTVVVGSPTDN